MTDPYAEYGDIWDEDQKGGKKGQRDLKSPHWPLELDILEDVAVT